jgi:hypothetical protein
LTDREKLTLDKGLERLERLWVTGRYIQVWYDFMDDAEIQLHVGRIVEDLGNAAQIAGYWRQFAGMNGINIPEET